MAQPTLIWLMTSFEVGTADLWFQRVTVRLIILGILSICAHAVVSTFIFRVPTSGWRDLALLAIAGLGFMVAVLWARHGVRRWLLLVGSRLDRIPAARFWFIVLAMGVGLRIAWWHVMPADGGGFGDAKANWDLATRLVRDGVYEVNTSFGTFRGLYPPGLPLTLAPLIALLGESRAVVLVANIAFFLFGLCFIYLSCRRLADEPSARMVALLTAVLPNLFMFASRPLKEPLVIAMLSAFTYAVVHANDVGTRQSAFIWAFAGGVSFGAAILTQSSLAPLVFIVIALDCILLRHSGRMARLSGIILGAFRVIVPWTARQTIIFHKLVPLTTGSGWSFYTANNPASLGGFTDYTAFFPDLLSVPEGDLSAVSFQRGLDFVNEQPERFSELVVRRQLLMTCCLDDAASLSLREAHSSKAAVACGQMVNCVAWLAVALTILVNCRSLTVAADRAPVVAVVLALPIGTFLIHSVMESGSRHMTMHFGAWLIALAIGLAARPAQSPQLHSDKESSLHG